MKFPSFVRMSAMAGFLCLAFAPAARCDIARLLHPTEDLLMGRGVPAALASSVIRAAWDSRSPSRPYQVSREGIVLRKSVSRISALNLAVRIPEDLDDLEAIRNEEFDFDLDRLSFGVGMELRF